MRIGGLATILTLLVACHPVLAQEEPPVVQQDFCDLSVDVPGKLGLSVDRKKLSTDDAGGTAARVTVSTGGSISFEISASGPHEFVSAPAGVDARFRTTFEFNGQSFVDELQGVLPASGTGNLVIDLEGTKDRGQFPPGDYNAGVVVTCEPVFGIG